MRISGISVHQAEGIATLSFLSNMTSILQEQQGDAKADWILEGGDGGKDKEGIMLGDIGKVDWNKA